MYDLTRSLGAQTPRFPGDPEVRIEPLSGTEPWQVSSLVLGTHSGTHMDAPRHRIAGGQGIGSFAPERLVGRGLVIDATGFRENEAIPRSVLDPIEQKIWPGWSAFLRTGWDRYWDDERYFQHPFVSPELAAELVALEVNLVAIDALSVDSTADDGSSAHLILLAARVLIAENVCNLGALEAGRQYGFAALPLSLGDADGAPARIVAWELDANR